MDHHVWPLEQGDTGPGGTGKTFTIEAIFASCRQEGFIPKSVASTRVAGTLPPGGGMYCAYGLSYPRRRTQRRFVVFTKAGIRGV
ncbi:hypothetical protein N7540_000621 [Penicillium herquei]|nr:hypothetical protein N7540_000621 [Penicillium herquei]